MSADAGKRGPSNPVDSPWYSTSNDQRVAKNRTLTLTDEAWKALGKLAETEGTSRSAIVAAMVAERALVRRGKR